MQTCWLADLKSVVSIHAASLVMTSMEAYISHGFTMSARPMDLPKKPEGSKSLGEEIFGAGDQFLRAVLGFYLLFDPVITTS